jgi:hypothetical protein
MTAALLLLSCGKEKNKNSAENQEVNEVTQTEEDTIPLAPQETFGLILVQDILMDEKETDLQLYLEETVYPLVSKSPKVTIDRISSSVYLLKYFDGTAEKNLYIQKYYNPLTDEIVFEKTDIKPASVNIK